MFTGKVQFTKWVNGRPYHISKTFDTPEEMDKYMSENNHEFYDLDLWGHMDHLMDRYRGLPDMPKIGHQEDQFSKYQNKLVEIKQAEREAKQAEQKKLHEIRHKQAHLNTLYQYRDQFQKAGVSTDDETMKELLEDIKNKEAEIDNLKTQKDS